VSLSAAMSQNNHHGTKRKRDEEQRTSSSRENGTNHSEDRSSDEVEGPPRKQKRSESSASRQLSSSPLIREGPQEEVPSPVGSQVAEDAAIEEILGDNFVEEEPEGEELMDDALIEKDYEPRPELDFYDIRDLDEGEYPPMSAAARAAAERELKERDRREGRGKARRMLRMPIALLSSEVDSSQDIPLLPRAHRYVASDEPPPLGAEDDEGDEHVALEDRKGPLREWIVLDANRREIARRYRTFLRTYVDHHGRNIYAERIKSMCAANNESLEVSYLHLAEQEPTIAAWLADAPTEILPIFDEVSMQEVLKLFPNYHQIHSEIHVRITDLPISDSLRDLRQIHLNCLLRVSGVVTRRTGVFPQLKITKYNCVQCGAVLGPFSQDNPNAEVKPSKCFHCHAKGPFTLNAEQTIYRNYQKITLQESPGTVPAGRLPRSKEVILLHDLIDCVRPGDEADITGIYKHSFDRVLNTQQGFPVFKTVIEANYVHKCDDIYQSFQLTEEDEKQIRQLAKDPHIGEKIIQSIAPSIFGHDDIKTAIALSLFGGEYKEIQQKHRIRGDINVLIVGDPGTAKSQFLKYIEKIAHRAVYTTGQGASAVGLTAAVKKDPLTREWTLEGGALVLADRGVCMIDEFDKMNDKDRTSIHEAMEQQTIAVAKAGIVTSLQARAAVIAAANPIKGRYDSSLSFAQNVELSEPILSRFDILCIVKDVVDPDVDTLLASFVVQSHIRSHPNYKEGDLDGMNLNVPPTEGPIKQELLRKYILYAKARVHPRLASLDQHKISKLYSEMRRESMIGGGVPMTIRHVESLIRIAEAHAKMHLREYITEDDQNMAIRVILNSFINAQKYSVAQNLKRTFKKYLTYKRDHNELLYHQLQNLVRETLSYQTMKMGEPPHVIEIDCEEFESRARELQITDLAPFYQSNLFLSNRFILDQRRRQIIKYLQ
jgi:DNA replication licensing factor MCM2